jgi:adenine-specific DNA-methyltransferase
MFVQEILTNTNNLNSFLASKGLKQEMNYVDSEFPEGNYYKIDQRKLLVVYEINNEQEFRSVKEHFFINRGLSYCILKFGKRIFFLRNFGESKYFLYSETTKNSISKIDRLKKIDKEGYDFIFQAGKDISARFYDDFKKKRNLLAQNITNEIDDIQKFLIAQKIFDRIFFIYFLCHKGIIKLDVIKKLTGENFFNILMRQNKFFDSLKKVFIKFNSEGKERQIELGEYSLEIPYLNGGLFRQGVYEKQINVSLDISQWKQIFNFLNDYHWIIEKINANEEHDDRILTPEILGHVYERSVVEWDLKGFEKEVIGSVTKLSERKKKGVYYTPETITDYISNNTIVPYVLECFESKYATIEDLMSSNNASDLNYALEKLKKIHIIDPACGSGAFLIKASTTLYNLQRRLHYQLGDKIDSYNLKLEIITKNIYGVDILSGAVEIAKLRIWLWLISDFDDENNTINTLPNIEYNIRVGNTLLGWLNEKLYQTSMTSPLTERIDGIFLGLMALTEESFSSDIKKARDLLQGYDLQGHIDAYNILYQQYRTTHGKSSENLKNILETVRNSIYSSITPAYLDYINNKIKPNYDRRRPPIKLENIIEMNIFHWKIDFGHIMLKGGFDIIVGNPPYVSAVKHSKDNKLERSIYRNIYEEVQGSYDLYSIFLLRGLQITNQNNIYSWIIPNKFLVSDYASKILIKLKEAGLSHSIDVSIFDVFKNIGIYPIIIMSNNKKEVKYIQYMINKIGDLVNNELIRIKEMPSYKTLSDFGIKIGSGTTGFQAQHIKPLITDKQNEIKENSIQFAVSGSIDQYFIDTKSVRYMKGKYTNPYINYDENIIANSKWAFWSNEKIAIAGMTKKIEAYYSKNSLALGVGCYAIYEFANFNPKYLLGILNSKYVTYYMINKFKDKHLAGGYLAINKSTIEQIPMIIAPKEVEEKIIQLVEKIMIKSKQYNSSKKFMLENEVINSMREIDNIVFDLFEIQAEKVKEIITFLESY